MEVELSYRVDKSLCKLNIEKSLRITLPRLAMEKKSMMILIFFTKCSKLKNITKKAVKYCIKAKVNIKCFLIPFSRVKVFLARLVPEMRAMNGKLDLVIEMKAKIVEGQLKNRNHL